MSITERRIREKEKVKETILMTAWEMVKAEGWQSLSIRKIAEAIGYSFPVIYDYFENKDAILTEFKDEGFRLLSNKARLAKEKYKEPIDQLRAMADAYWNFAFKNREYYQLMYGVGMAGCEGGKCTGDKGGFDRLVFETIQSIIERNKKKQVNACLKYHTFNSILHGIVSIKMMGNSPVQGELNKMVLDDAIEGFIRNLT